MDWNDLFNKWYMFLSSLNSALALPIRDFSDGLGIPLVSAFLFGLLGATAPCQLSTNFGALAFLTRQPGNRGATFRATLAYVAAKMLVYTILGLVVLTLGQGLINALLPYLDWVRKLIGPLMIVLGLAVLGVFRFRFQVGVGTGHHLGIGQQLLGKRAILRQHRPRFQGFRGDMHPDLVRELLVVRHSRIMLNVEHN